MKMGMKWDNTGNIVGMGLGMRMMMGMILSTRNEMGMALGMGKNGYRGENACKDKGKGRIIAKEKNIEMKIKEKSFEANKMNVLIDTIKAKRQAIFDEKGSLLKAAEMKVLDSRVRVGKGIKEARKGRIIRKGEGCINEGFGPNIRVRSPKVRLKQGLYNDHDHRVFDGNKDTLIYNIGHHSQKVRVYSGLFARLD